jgi:hypothetical protein
MICNYLNILYTKIIFIINFFFLFSYFNYSIKIIIINMNYISISDVEEF